MTLAATGTTANLTAAYSARHTGFLQAIMERLITEMAVGEDNREPTRDSKR